MHNEINKDYMTLCLYHCPIWTISMIFCMSCLLWRGEFSHVNLCRSSAFIKHWVKDLGGRVQGIPWMLYWLLCNGAIPLVVWWSSDPQGNPGENDVKLGIWKCLQRCKWHAASNVAFLCAWCMIELRIWARQFSEFLEHYKLFTVIHNLLWPHELLTSY